MKVRIAYYSKKCPTQLIVEMPDGRMLWGRMVPARKLQEDELAPLPASYHSLMDYEMLPAEAKALYGLEYTTAETAP